MSIRNRILTAVATGSALLLVGASGALAQQTSAQQKCLNLLNKGGRLVAKAQGKENTACIKAAGKGTLAGLPSSCLVADSNGKVQKKEDKTIADDGSFCGTPPSFGYTGGAAVNAAAILAERDLVGDVFGDLDSAVISCATSKAGCLCQQKVSGSIEKLAAVKILEFVKCKKTVLKAGANSAASLQDCVSNASTAGSIAADTKGKIQKAIDGLAATIVKSCDMPGVTAGAFPGACTGQTGGALGACIDRQVECRVCQMINEMDGLFVNCDQFDDGLVNGTCASGTGPTPTPSPSPTPTPTGGAGDTFLGALVRTTGRFNYGGTLGLTGADTACTTNFGTSHACTYAELQTAAAAGELVGATATNGVTVTSFWAIDGAQPETQQCHEDIPWDYATAHTGTFAQTVALNNAAGTLGSLTSNAICATQHWVGCCQ
jgi:hypothetical protein